MSLPAPARTAFRNQLAMKLKRSLKRGLFFSTLGTISFYFAHTLPTLRQVEVAWSTIDPDKLYRNMQAAGAFTYIDKNNKFSYPVDDDDD